MYEQTIDTAFQASKATLLILIHFVLRQVQYYETCKCPNEFFKKFGVMLCGVLTGANLCENHSWFLKGRYTFGYYSKQILT